MSNPIHSLVSTSVHHKTSSHKLVKKSVHKSSAPKKAAVAKPKKESMPTSSPALLKVLKATQKLDPEKSTKPTMSHKIAAHFLSGPFIKEQRVDGEKLEGSDPGSIAAYFLHTLKDVEQEEGLTGDKELAFLRKSLRQMLRVEAAVQKIRSIYPKPEQWEKRAKLFSEWMIHMITTMKAGEQWMIPGGWLGKRSSGHAEIYQFIKQKDGRYSMRVYNAGAGIQYHLLNGSKVLPLSKKDLSLKSLQRPEVWQTYYEMTHEYVPYLHQPNVSKYYEETTETQCYQWLESIHKGFIVKGAKEMLASKLEPSDFHNQQKYNTCAFESIWMLGKQTKSFLSVKEKIRRKAFADYAAYLVDKGYLPAADSDVAAVATTREGILRNQGILDFFHECLKRFSKETLKEIRKRPKGTPFKGRRERIALLKDFEARIHLQRTACQAKLKELTALKPFGRDRSHVMLHLPQRNTDVPKGDKAVKAPSSRAPSLKWPPKEKLIDWVQEWTGGNYIGSIDLSLRYSFISALISQIPSIDDSYWDDLGDYSTDAIETVYRLVDMLSHVSVGENLFDPELHYFQMEKVLVIMLKLSQSDPILSKIVVDLSWLPGNSINDAEHYRMLSALNPQTDKQILATRAFLKEYQQQPGKKTIFSEIPLKGGPGEFYFHERIDNGNTFSSSNEAEAIWDYLQADGGRKKKEIEDRIKKQYPELADKPLPNSLIVAYAMTHYDSDDSIRGLPTPSFRMVKQHIFSMMYALYLKQGGPIGFNLSPILSEYDGEMREFTIIARGTRGNPWHKKWADLSGIKDRFFSKKEKDILELQDEELRGLQALCSLGIKGKKEEFFENDPMDRPIRAIEFFTKYSHLLDKPENQVILSSCLFHPGLLRAQLKCNPGFAQKLAQFIAMQYASASKERVETALFILRLSSQLEAYCQDNLDGDPILETVNFPSFLQEIAALQKQIEEDAELPKEKQMLLRSLIAREALAFLGRGNKKIKQIVAEPRCLKEIFQYQLFLTDHAVPETHTNYYLEEQGRKGRLALIQLLQELRKKPSFRISIGQALGQALGLQVKREINWDFSTLPVIKGTLKKNGKKGNKVDYALHLDSGSLFIDGKRSADSPPLWLRFSGCYRLFIQDAHCSRFQEEEGPPKECYFISNGRELHIRTKENGDFQVFMKYKNRWCQLETNLLMHLRSITKQSDPWLDGNKIRFFSKTTGRLTHLYEVRKERLLRLKDRLEAADMEQEVYKHFTRFDPYAQVWKTVLGTVKQVDLPSFGLVFDADETGRFIGTGDFAGMRIAQQQSIKTLTGVSGYLVLENPVTKEKRVLLPIRSLHGKQEFTEPYNSSGFDYYSKKVDYAVFNVVGKGERLEPTRHEKRVQESLYLVNVYLAQHKHAQAYQLLVEQAISPQPYTAAEWTILLEILQDFPHHQAEESPEALAIRLKTAAIVFKNHQQDPLNILKESHQDLADSWSKYCIDQDKQAKKTLSKDFRAYSKNKMRIPEFMRLTADEEALLQGYMNSGAKFNSSSIPAGYSIDKGNNRTVDRFSWIWLNCKNSDTPSLDILDKRAFSPQLAAEEMGKAFLSFYAISCDSSTDAVSLERKARLNVFLENAFTNSRGDTAQLCKILQLILQGKVAKEKVPTLKEMERLLKGKNFTEDDDQRLKDFFKLVELFKPCESFSYNLPFQTAAKPSVAAIPPSGYQPIPHLPSPAPKPIIGEITQAVLFNQAPKKPILLSEFVNEGLATEKPEKNALQVLQASAEDYVKELNRSSEWTIDDVRLVELERILTEKIETNRPLLRQRQQALRNLANAYPSLSASAIEHTLKQKAELREKIDWRHLQLLYVQGNALAYKELNPLLNDEMVAKIYHDTEELLLDATQQKQRARALRLITDIKTAKSTHQRAELVQKLYQEISTKRAYSPVEHSEILVYEYRRDLRLRESQVRQIEMLMNESRDLVLEIIMGSGKSDILLPLIALKLADGKKLSMLVVPEELIDTITSQMHIRARGIFRQTANRLNWNLAPSALYENLKRIIAGREFLLVTTNELHQFALAARKAREDYLRAGAQSQFLRAKLQGYGQVLRLLKTKGYAVIDEVDSQLRTDLQVLRALGVPSRIPKEYCDATAILFDILKTDKRITSKVYFDFSKTHKKTAQPYVEKKHKTFLIRRLAKKFLASPKIKQLRLSYDKKKDRKVVLNYLMQSPEKGFSLPDHFDQRTKDTLAIVRNQLHVIFPITLGKIYNENYGLFPEKANENGKKKETHTAIPYGGALKPRPESEFASYQEQISYILQSYLKGGLSAKLAKFYLEKIRSEMFTEMKRTSLAPQLTRAYSRYVGLVGKELAKKYPLETIKTKQYQELAEEISKKPRILIRFIERCILPLIKQYPGYISSNGKTLVDMLFRVHGVSGTVERDKDSLSSRFEVTTDATIRGKTLVLSEKIEKPLILKTTLKPIELLKETLERAAAHKEVQDYSIRALIDRGALFKDLEPIEAAKVILEWGKTQKPPIESVIYYDKNKKLVLERGKSEPQFYNADLDKDPAKRFTLYPQPQTIGADIPQTYNAAAIVTMNKNTDYQQVEQAGWRMRGLDKGQCLIWAAPEDAAALTAEKAEKPVEEITSSDLLTYTVLREVRTQMVNNPKAVYQMLDSAFLNQCEAIFDVLPIEQWQKPVYQELHRFTTTVVKDEPYKQFGQKEVIENAEKVLHDHRRALIGKLTDWFDRYKLVLTGDFGGQLKKIIDIQGLDQQMGKIIDKAVDPQRPLVPETLPTKQNGMQETEVELEQETEKETENENEQENQREVNLTLRKMEDWVEPISWIDPKEMFEEDYFSPYSMPDIGSFSEVLKDGGSRPILTVSDTLLIDEEGVSPSQRKASHFFSPNLLTSFNAASATGGSRLFRGNQRPLGSMLLIQDKENPQDVRLMVLSFDEEKEMLKYLRQDQQDADDVDSRRYNLALFSPSMHSTYGDGIYAEGASSIDRETLYAKSLKGTLTAFEELVLQGKIAMGETRAYSNREEQHILKRLKEEQLTPTEFGKVFERVFLPGLVQTVANSTMEALIKGSQPKMDEIDMAILADTGKKLEGKQSVDVESTEKIVIGLL